MRLPFLNRKPELARLRAALRARDGALLCIYGRRRLGKSRLVQQVLEDRRAVYYVGDERDAPLQRAALAAEIDAQIPGFAAVRYDDWAPLLERFWREAPRGVVLSLDEFPSLVRVSPELPSLLQKLVDRGGPGRHVVLCGSSQRMMQGLVLDAGAPLFGRAREILRVEALGPGALRSAFGLRSAAQVVEHWATWGGVPRYWELALDHAGRDRAVRELALDPAGVLHREPERLLLDDVQDVVRTASILALVGQGAHRTSEIAARLSVPATSLSRSLMRLLELGLIEREVPFGRSLRDTKRTLYRIADPFLRFFFRFVEPHRSRLAAGQIAEVQRIVQRDWPQFLGQSWEQLVRASIARLRIGGLRWEPASRWWGPGGDGRPLELDIVARCADDSSHVLVGEAKLRMTQREARACASALADRARGVPELRGCRITPAVFALSGPRGTSEPTAVSPSRVLEALS